MLLFYIFYIYKFNWNAATVTRPLPLVFADLCSAPISTMTVSHCLVHLPVSSAGVLVCKTVPFVQTTAIVTGILTMTCIAIERYQGIVYPLKMRRQSSPRRAYTILGMPRALLTLLAFKWCLCARVCGSVCVGVNKRGCLMSFCRFSFSSNQPLLEDHSQVLATRRSKNQDWTRSLFPLILNTPNRIAPNLHLIDPSCTTESVVHLPLHHRSSTSLTPAILPTTSLYHTYCTTCFFSPHSTLSYSVMWPHSAPTSTITSLRFSKALGCNKPLFHLSIILSLIDFPYSRHHLPDCEVWAALLCP